MHYLNELNHLLHNETLQGIKALLLQAKGFLFFLPLSCPHQNLLIYLAIAISLPFAGTTIAATAILFLDYIHQH